MSDENATPVLPPIPELTVGKAHRLICADYLRTLAKLIEQGGLEAFELAWNLSFRKPQGKVVTTADSLTGPVEAQFLANVRAYQEEQARKVPVIDLTEEMKENHPEIVDPDNKDDSNLS